MSREVGVMLALISPVKALGRDYTFEQVERFSMEILLPAGLAETPSQISLLYRSVDSSKPLRLMDLLPLENPTEFWTSWEFLDAMTATRRADILGEDDMNNALHFDARPHIKMSTFEGNGSWPSVIASARTVLVVFLDTPEDDMRDVDAWFGKEHARLLSTCKEYRRSTSYRRYDGNDPLFISIQEYACQATDIPDSGQVGNKDWEMSREAFELIGFKGDKSVVL